MSEQLNDTQPAYDMYIEEDRVTFVRRPEPVVESTPVQEPLRFVPLVMLGAHGLIAFLALLLAAYLTIVPATATVYALASGVPALAHVYTLPALTMSKSEIVSTTGRASSKPVGSQATQVMVTITQTCTPAAYNTSELQRALASLIAGKTPEQAQAILQQQGIKQAGIRLDWLHDHLPVNIDQIKIVLVFH